jgi:NAD(P)-dependent dehydrogenase (short-subunit alcohol dehydrogenase family)
MTEWKLALPDQVVITGTSSGLGLAMARLLTSTGVRVYGVDAADPAAGPGQPKDVHGRAGQRDRRGHLATSHCRGGFLKERLEKWRASYLPLYLRSK